MKFEKQERRYCVKENEYAPELFPEVNCQSKPRDR